MIDISTDDLPVAKTALFLQTIKSATAKSHILLESNLLLSAIVSPGGNHTGILFIPYPDKEVGRSV